MDEVPGVHLKVLDVQISFKSKDVLYLALHRNKIYLKINTMASSAQFLCSRLYFKLVFRLKGTIRRNIRSLWAHRHASVNGLRYWILSLISKPEKLIPDLDVRVLSQSDILKSSSMSLGHATHDMIATLPGAVLRVTATVLEPVCNLPTTLIMFSRIKWCLRSILVQFYLIPIQKLKWFYKCAALL